MALAMQITIAPEVLTAMDVQICRRHRIRMIEIAGADGCFRCPITGCDNAYDTPPSTPNSPPPRRLVCVKPSEPMPTDNPLIERAFGYQAGYTVDPNRWADHCAELAQRQTARLYGPIPQVPQCNASPEYSIMNGPAAPGGGSKNGGRRKKKKQGGQTFTDTPWGAEGGTNKR